MIFYICEGKLKNDYIFFHFYNYFMSKKPRNNTNKSKIIKKINDAIDYNYYLENELKNKESTIKELEERIASMKEIEIEDNKISDLEYENDILKIKVNNLTEELDKYRGAGNMVHYITELEVKNICHKNKIKMLKQYKTKAEELEKELAAYKELCIKMEQEFFKHK